MGWHKKIRLSFEETIMRGIALAGGSGTSFYLHTKVGKPYG